MEHKETGCQAPPEAPKLCANNCGFFGSAATMNLCSKCHKDFEIKQEQVKLAASSIGSIVNGGGPNDHGKKTAIVTSPTKLELEPAVSSIIPTQTSWTSPNASSTMENVKEIPNRCSSCRKRVGLTGFNCRCGSLFCAVHRYSDKHDCTFDYQSVGRVAIAKANPVVKAEKLDKI